MFKRWTKQVALAIFLILWVGAPYAGAHPNEIDWAKEAKWKNRLLIVCTLGDNEIGEAKLAEAQLALADVEGFAERKIHLIELRSTEAHQWFFAPVISPSPLFFYATRSSNMDLYERTNCGKSGSENISLIGLDGAVKAQWRTPVPNEALFALIDAMPMRASEVRRQADSD